MSVENLIGQKFNRLTVISQAESKNQRRYWNCLCECGNNTIVTTSKLKNGHTKSCGCIASEIIIKRNTTHGLRKTRIYNIWYDIKRRCYNKKNKSYSNYGGRGISVCDEWLNDFMNFYNWAMENGYTDDLTIDRIDVNGNYEPSNCCWVTKAQQSLNRRSNVLFTYNGETMCISEWCKKLNLNPKKIRSRINNCGWSIEESLDLTPRSKK